MKTKVYIDGYNLYYGCLKNTPYKWLDLHRLIELLISRSDHPDANINTKHAIKFTTADISPKAASDQNSPNDQRSYHQALYLYRPTIEIIKGAYSIEKSTYPIVEQDESGKDKSPSESQRMMVWKIEEKQSDVNVALEAVYDVLTDSTLEQVIFVTNDTDIIPALKKIRLINDERPNSTVQIGLITPSRVGKHQRTTNPNLSKLATWTIEYITNEELETSQLPSRVSGKKSSAIKPTSWFKHAQEVQEILDILTHLDVLGSIPRAWRWLSEPKPEVEGLPILVSTPDRMLNTLAGIEAVKLHAITFAQYKINQQKK
ncbi:NYN domain-containing protein [Marinomonas profundi]|uniref:NYN domain-containing protein n=1 Tax=Marinomonas profundi TaxID=2726122 RepID=UPI001B3A9AC2|nr:NYN domain-containing protein [Marinomonas profundi]UDV04577.1 NYN domain-containing protein [Marinomonas profundi]